MSAFDSPVLVAGPPRTATSWTAKVLSCGGLIRYAREPVFQGKPQGYDPSLDNVFLEAADEHAVLNTIWSEALSFRTRLEKRWIYGESSALVRRIPVLPARMLVKEVNASLSLEWLEKKFGFRIVVTLRHPCGFWVSALKLREIGHDTLSLNALLAQDRLMSSYFPEDGDWLGALAADDERLLAAYCMIVRVIEQQKRQRPDWVVCLHEHMCANPEREFRRIFEALSLPFTAKAHRFIEASSRESRGGIYGLSRNSALEASKWMRSLDQPRIRRAHEIMGKLGIETFS